MRMKHGYKGRCYFDPSSIVPYTSSLMTEAAALSFLFRGRGQAMRLRICPREEDVQLFCGVEGQVPKDSAVFSYEATGK